MADSWNSPLINVLTSADADVLRQIFTTLSQELARLSSEIESIKRGGK